MKLMRWWAFPVAVSLLGTLPFLLLEAWHRPGLWEDFPFFLFALLWILAGTFAAVLQAIVRGRAIPSRLLIGVVLLAVLGSAWGAVVLDQMPCFLGVRNCD